MLIKSIESQNIQNNVQTKRRVTQKKKKVYTLHELNLKCKLKNFIISQEVFSQYAI